MPLLAALFDAAMTAAGLSYLAQNNFSELLTAPFFWLWAVVAVLLVAFYALIDVSACILLC